MRICYVGHPAHAWSGSSKFFENLLEELGSLTVYRPTPVDIDNVIRTAFETNYDLYVFFQFDFLAYAFAYAGKKVIVVPMIDGSASYGSEHWRLLRGAKFISFSKSLDEYLRFNGHESFRIQYWPAPNQQSRNKENSIYYWPRGHHQYVSVRKILASFENYPEMQIRVRKVDSPDSELDYSRFESERLKIVTVETREKHLSEIKKSKIYIAPRPSEGIGQSFLEAMSYGTPVLSRDYPTMSEYILPGVNGLFFSANNRSLHEGIDFEMLGRNSHEAVRSGYEIYLRAQRDLQVYVLDLKNKNLRIKVSEVHRLLDVSCAIMRRQYFPKGSVNTLQNWIRFKNMF